MSGSPSKSARERRTREIIAESGADTVEHFDPTLLVRAHKRSDGSDRGPTGPGLIADLEQMRYSETPAHSVSAAPLRASR